MRDEVIIIIKVIIFGIFAIAFWMGVVFVIKTLAKGVQKIKDVANLRGDELAKVDIVIARLSHIEINPQIGKAEFIDFYLDASNESAFYAIPPNYLKRLRIKLEGKIKQLKETNGSYGYAYAQRRFFIGNKLILNWQNEVKI